MRLTVWHNTDSFGCRAYEPAAPMLRVFSYFTNLRPGASTTEVEREMWRAVTLFNADTFADPVDRALAQDYRARRLRSFSRGDGFSVSTGAAERFFVSDGLSLTPHDGPWPVLATQPAHGSQPLGRHLRYRLLGDPLGTYREGMFEREGQSAAEIASLHGVLRRAVLEFESA
ncbi:hypothetical protein [Kitasatospora sp. NPDC088783]|uniref:hypothetical protein n=1 Tax=Kitasatospora sp. NPDC088783 TaxID=3364077 RepID=UPI0037F1C492